MRVVEGWVGAIRQLFGGSWLKCGFIGGRGAGGQKLVELFPRDTTILAFTWTQKGEGHHGVMGSLDEAE